MLIQPIPDLTWVAVQEFTLPDSVWQWVCARECRAATAGQRSSGCWSITSPLLWRFEDLSIVPQPVDRGCALQCGRQRLPQTPRQDAGRYLDGIVVPALAEPQIHFGTAWDVPTYRN